MSQISKQALAVENTTSFPNNNTGYITPVLLRDFNTDMIDSTVNQIVYTDDSSSWNSKISQLNAFTASQQPTFTALNAFTASQLSINSGVNTFTQSTTGRLTTLETETSNLELFTSSINQIIVNGVSIGTSTRFFFNGTVSASIVPNVGGAIASITILSDGTKLNTSSFNEYTASNAASQSVFSASVATSISSVSASLSAFTQSQTIWNASATASIQELLNLSSSLSGGYATQGELDYSSSVLQANIDTKLNTSSFNQFTSSTIFGLGFATTGSNVFTGDQTFIDAANNFFTITDTSGSMMLVGKSYTSASAHLTSSANQVNIIIKSNNNTGDTVISGSNNVISNPATPTTGFRRYYTNANISLQGGAPQISSSMGFSPTISANNILSNGNPLTIRGPVSSSTYTIQQNVIAGGTINLGTAATTNFEKATNGLNFNQNIINGTVSVTAYKTAFTNTSAIAVAANNIGGATTLNADSASITLANNTIQNGGFVVNNSYYNASATGGGNSLQITNGNGIFGNATSIFVSGSNTTAGTGRQFQSNLLAGSFNSASLNLNGDNSNMFATAIIGHGLNVTGSSALTPGAPIRSNTYGSAFFGRYNAEDGNRARTAETVFAIGTGTTSVSKTGFLVDSGSNTFVEGTLNVSGSLLFTGSVYGNVVSASIASSTASIDLSVGNYFTLTLAGTANINVTNPRPGVTATLVITTDTGASASFSSNVKQPSGSLYAASPSGNIDIISFTSVNTTTVYAFPAQTFV
jgi:hypothetical protein